MRLVCLENEFSIKLINSLIEEYKEQNISECNERVLSDDYITMTKAESEIFRYINQRLIDLFYDNIEDEILVTDENDDSIEGLFVNVLSKLDYNKLKLIIATNLKGNLYLLEEV